MSTKVRQKSTPRCESEGCKRRTEAAYERFCWQCAEWRAQVDV